MSEKKTQGMENIPGLCAGDAQRIKRLLDRQAARWNDPAFVLADPVRFPRRYARLQDIEIAGLLCATVAWGRRSAILDACERMLAPMGDSPYEYVMRADALPLRGGAVHRTFSQADFAAFLRGLKSLYSRYDSLQALFAPQKGENGLWEGIRRFRGEMLRATADRPSLARHISCPDKQSACKRLHLFLRWMVRRDGIVDLGVWRDISPGLLSIPLDVHVGRVARRLGLIVRNRNDRRAVEQLDAVLRRFDPSDPARYDFALFGLGAGGYPGREEAGERSSVATSGS